MLNITPNNLNRVVSLQKYAAYQKVHRPKHYQYFNWFLILFATTFLITLFLPWTQNVEGYGFVTTLTPGQRPQTIQSPIPGQIVRWYVNEGDFVNKGDTIIHISEIKTEYQDPLLVERTNRQQDAKSRSVSSYKEKTIALDSQVIALQNERGLKGLQAKNKWKQSLLKVTSDSIDFQAAKTNFEIAKRQYNRTIKLHEEGLKSLAQVEVKRLKLQETQAKLISQENKVLTSRNNVLNTQIEISRINAEYANKIAKTQSERFSAASAQFDAEAQVSKLKNKSSSYKMRASLYYITAAQSGYINKALKSGIGETFKEGEKLVGIMPANYDLAVETFLRPIDLPLIHLGEDVRIQFDGWPAIFFSGWPNASFGTYAGKIVAIENFISSNGKFRILIAPDTAENPWPKKIRVGSGAQTIALLEDVPIWYELWRKLNGFPPNYYQSKKKQKMKKEKH